MLHREPGATAINEEAMAAAVAFGGYLYELVVDKRANPSDDLLSRLCAVEAERDGGERAVSTTSR